MAGSWSWGSRRELGSFIFVLAHKGKTANLFTPEGLCLQSPGDCCPALVALPPPTHVDKMTEVFTCSWLYHYEDWRACRFFGKAENQYYLLAGYLIAKICCLKQCLLLICWKIWISKSFSLLLLWSFLAFPRPFPDSFSFALLLPFFRLGH